MLDPRNAVKAFGAKTGQWAFGLGEMGGGRGRKAVYRNTAAQRDESTTCCVDTWKNGTSFKSQIGTSNNRGSFGEASNPWRKRRRSNRRRSEGYEVT